VDNAANGFVLMPVGDIPLYICFGKRQFARRGVLGNAKEFWLTPDFFVGTGRTVLGRHLDRG